VSAYHYVKPGAAGRWLVVHDVPGTTTASVDADCLTMCAADREAAWLNAERDRNQRDMAAERALLGWRELPSGWSAHA
jgi:hypothetical protein